MSGPARMLATLRALMTPNARLTAPDTAQR